MVEAMKISYPSLAGPERLDGPNVCHHDARPFERRDVSPAIIDTQSLISVGIVCLVVNLHRQHGLRS